MHSVAIVAAVLLLLVQLAGRAASFVLDDAISISFSFGQQLCSVEKYVRVAQCDNASSDTQAQRFVGTSRSTERVLFGSPDGLLQCDEDARNQSFWTWSVNCSSQVWSSEVKAQLDMVRLTARRDSAGRWVLGASNLEALRNSCVVVVHPVLHLDIRASVDQCQPAQSDALVLQMNRHYPLEVMYRPLVTSLGSMHVSVTYSLQLADGQWLTTCGANATFNPHLDACLSPSFANYTPACDSWLRFDHFVPAFEHGRINVVHNGTTYTLDSYQYELNDEHQWLYVCETNLLEQPEEAEDWQRQVERCLFIISALADLANILVHLTLRAQRTLPGRIVLCLSGTLFASDLSCFLLTFLRSVETLWVCFAVRSVAHYLSLCASCWTQVLWYDLWQTISASRAVDSCRHVHTRFYRYVVFSWVVPLLFPATRLVVDVHSTMYMPGDDENAESKRLMVCNQQPLVYYLTFSAIPVSCILVMNTVFLARSCCLIRRVVLDTERVGISNNFMNAQQQFGLYTKLFFLCGFTSLFGFVSEILKNQNVSESLNEIFASISGILDSSLGLCVSLPFLCEPRVGIRFIRAIFIRKPQPPRARNAAKVIINRDGTSPGLCNHV